MNGRVIQPLPRAKIRHPTVIAARERAHAAFDQLWKSGMMTRDAAYAWLCSVMKLSPREAHIGRMHPEQCDRLVKAVVEKLDKHKVPPLNATFGTLREAVVEMSPVLRSELLRALLEAADHETISAVTANGRLYTLETELTQARAELGEVRADAFAELEALRQKMRADAEQDAAERADLRRRTEDLERRVAEALVAVAAE